MTPLSALIAFPVAAALIGVGVRAAGFMLHGIGGVAGITGISSSPFFISAS